MKKGVFVTIFLGIIVFLLSLKFDINPLYAIGDEIDELDGVVVYYNGPISNVGDRKVLKGYNVGLEFQCVEFVKRYYYEIYHHKMQNSYGHAKSFFIKGLKDGSYNSERDLTQFSNGSFSMPQQGDLVIFDASFFNSYGHVAIISNVTENSVEIIQQNPGQFSPSRKSYSIQYSKEKRWTFYSSRILGWLRKS